MPDDLRIAPAPELVRYLCLFHRWLTATQRYIRNHDRDGILLSAWIADTVHNVPGMLWHYDPGTFWNSPAQLAKWTETFPQVVKEQNAPERIAADCDYIFSPVGAAQELGLADDLADIDLAPPEKLVLYLELIYRAYVGVRYRPGPDPWLNKEDGWRSRQAAVKERLGRLAGVLIDVPPALVHWSALNEDAFAERIHFYLATWPAGYGLDRGAHQQAMDRVRPLWDVSLPPGASSLGDHAVLSWLVAQYRQPWRAYHTLSHVERMFTVWMDVAEAVPVTNRHALALAIWFHDAVYDPERQDNEARSAAEAARWLAPLGIREETLSGVRRMILATTTHRPADDDPDMALLLDLDLAILGARPEEYDAFAAAIGRGYGLVPDSEYRAGRTRVLSHFLERPRIYLTEPMYARFEEPARRNLAREIEALRTNNIP